MSDVLTAKTEEELQRARRLIRRAGRIALGTILFLIVFLLFDWIVQLFQLRVDEKVFHIILGFVGGGLFLSAGLALIGASTIWEDREVREHTGNRPIYNPFSQGARSSGWIFLLLSAGSIVAGIIVAIQTK